MNTENWPLESETQWLLVTLSSSFRKATSPKNRMETPKESGKERLGNSHGALLLTPKEINRVLSGHESIIKQGYASNWRKKHACTLVGMTQKKGLPGNTDFQVWASSLRTG